MPRKRQPTTLRAASLRTLASFILESCKKRDGKHDEEIRQYVQDIPNTFANEYVNEVLQLSLTRRYYFDFTIALHPKCTEVRENKDAGYFVCYWPSQTLSLSSLHVMTDLIKIEPEINAAWQGEQCLQFPCMSNLRSVNVSLSNHPRHFQQFLENCPCLEDIGVDIVNLYVPCARHDVQSTLPLLSKCKHLKRICVPDVIPELAIHLLDHLPNLEVLQVKCILEVLPVCKRAYKLKDFVTDLDASKVASLQEVVTSVATHFPYLEKLTLILGDNAHVNMISELTNLKSLTVCNGKSSNPLFLTDKCMFGLQHLQLRNITGLDSLFKQNMNVSYPNLESLEIFWCTGISVAGIREIFPNLKSLQLLCDEYLPHSLPCTMARAGSQALEHLQIKNVPVQQVRYLIPFCGKLKNLKISNTSVKSCVYEHICNANLKELRTLDVLDHSMKWDVIQLILDSCGDYLERVDLHSRKLIFSSDHVRELSHQLQQYDMHFSINDHELQ